jgi:SAM-dependent methyltransferase
MAEDDVLKTAVRLGVSVDALAALAAHVRLATEQLPADPAVRDLLATIATELVGNGVPDPAAAAPTVGLARTFLRQAAELVDNPGRSGSWDQVDGPLLQSMGRLSMGISAAVLVAERRLPDLGARLCAADARFLDVGTGTGWLAIAIAQTHQRLHLVGIDIFQPALDLARANVEGAGLRDRIELRLQDATSLDEPNGYDAIWLALPFLPKAAVGPIMNAAVRSLKPGGWLLPGTFTGPGDRLSELLTDLRTVRSGGHPWRPEEIIDLLATAGLADAQEIPRSWPAPVRLYAGLRR